MSNPIDPGYEWSQAFDFPAGFLQPSDGLRAQFRARINDPRMFVEIETPDGIVINGDRVFMYLSAEQTTSMNQFEVVTNFVLQRDGKETPIGVLITIPVLVYPTRP